MRENTPPSRFLKEKRQSAKSDVSKVLFPDIGKITNQHRGQLMRVKSSMPMFQKYLHQSYLHQKYLHQSYLHHRYFH